MSTSPMRMANAFNPAHIETLPLKTQQLIHRRQQAMGAAYRLFYETPLHFVASEGVWLIDAEGNRYLDGYNNVACVGHCNPHVIHAITQQAQQLNTHTRYLNETVIAYAEKLLATFPTPIDNVIFTCTGSEANDLALRIAHTVTKGTGVIITEFAYHGVTSALATLSPSLGAGVTVEPHVRFIPAPNTFEHTDIVTTLCQAIDSAVQDMLEKGIQPSAILLDGIFSSDGVFAHPKGFLKPIIDRARSHGMLYIADEVQAGFGRLGEGLWGFDRHGVIPDLVTLGKPMGNGHPIAAVAGQSRWIDIFGNSVRYFNTFGGNPVSCAAADAVLNILQQPDFIPAVADVGSYFQTSLRKIAENYPQFADIRGAGLFIGVEIRDPLTQSPDAVAAKKIVNGLAQRRVLISASGPKENILKIRPPLIFTRSHVDQFIHALSDTLANIY